MPPNTVSVARPSRCGNPFKVGEPISVSGVQYGDAGRYTRHGAVAFDLAGIESFGIRPVTMTPDLVVVLFAVDVEHNLFLDDDGTLRADIDEHLRGKNLACWCAHGQKACHADVWLEVANR